MSRYKIVILPIAILYAVLTVMAFLRFQTDWKEYNEQLYLDMVINYCVDSAVEEMVSASGDLTGDHGIKDYSRVNPVTALNAFCSMFCECLGYSQSEENLALIRNNYLKGFAVVAYDGVYIAEPVVLTDGSVELAFGLKIPFEYNGLCLNLKNETYSYWNASTNSVEVVPSTISTEQMMRVVNEVVTDEFMSSIFRNTDGEILNAFFVPSDMSDLSHTNPVKGISVLAYVKGVQISSANSLDSFAVGGSRIDEAKQVIAYIRDGEKYYFEASGVPDDAVTIEVFKSSVEAARAGYKYDVDRFN